MPGNDSEIAPKLRMLIARVNFKCCLEKGIKS